MATPTFLAIVYAEDAAPAARRIMSACAPVGVEHMMLADGALMFGWWNQPPKPGEPLLATVDGTGGAPDVAVPHHLIDMARAPEGLRSIAVQHRSYLWLDKTGVLSCWTDHLGISRLYHIRTERCDLITDDAGMAAGFAAGIDPAMIASFLVNGCMLRGRTLFSGLRSLPPASLVRIGPNRLSATAYWRYRPGDDVWRDKKEMEHELWSRITGAVLSHVAGRHPLLALSGGYDSTAILGILHGAGVQTSTFSFSMGEPRRGSDPDAARRQAALLGVPHRVYRIDDFSVTGMIGSHVRDGLFMRKGCFEVDAFARAAAHARERDPTSMFCFGDEAFGQSAYRLDTNEDLLGSAALKDPALLGAIVPALTNETAATLRAALRLVYGEILSAAPKSSNLDDIKDSLFLDTFLIANMVQMRHLAVAPLLPFASPFLDLGVLDMARHIPSGMRVEKRCFESLAMRRLPALFRARRASFRQSQPDLHKAILLQSEELRATIRALRDGIPGIMAPTELDALLDAALRPPARRSRLSRATDFLARAALNRNLVPDALHDGLKRRYWGRYRAGPTLPTFFVRALHLALLMERHASSDPAGLPLNPPPAPIAYSLSSADGLMPV
ncbi:asparagine synthase-related protein [Iodidimonas sp. SYSU 1G8]|uniref:asparagine synthase-related protein n=1 Tax=Iodidimonas sp. SYSU 1G8 TaxID=3133967 RepID=UPI0031FF0986